MADIDFKNSVNVDTAYVDGHKVKLIAVPDGSLELPISANDEYGYVVDANGKKHRVLLVTFLAGDPDFKSSPNADTAYMTVNDQKVKVRLGAKLNGTQYLSNSANVNDGYTEDDDGNKHRTILVSEPTGTLELPTSETSDSAYVIDNDGNKHKVRLFAVLAGGTTIVEVTVSGVPPLNLLGAVEDSLSSVKAYGGLLQGGVPSGYTAVEYVENAASTMVKTAIHIGNDDNFKIDITATAVTGSFYLFQARDKVNTSLGNANITGISGATSGNTLLGSPGIDGVSVSNGLTRANRTGHKMRFVLDIADGNMSWYVRDLDGNVENTATGTYDQTQLDRATTNMCIYGNEAPAGSGAGQQANRLAAGCKVYGAKLWKNGVLVMDYVPATRDSDSAVGFYDRVSHTFVTAADGSLTAGSSLAPTPSDPVDLVCNNGKISVLDHTNWTIKTNPTSQTGQGIYINTTNGRWYTSNDRGAGAIIPITVGKKYTMLINKKTLGLGNFLRYGQSATSTPSGQQLVDWYAGVVQDGQIVSFTAKKDYFVFQMSADFVEAGGIDEAVEVIEAQGGDYTFLKYIEATGTQYIQTTISGPARWVGAGQGTSDSNGSKCILSAKATTGGDIKGAVIWLGSRYASTDAGKKWTLGGAGTGISMSNVDTTAFAKYDVTFADDKFIGKINDEILGAVTNNWSINEWRIGTSFANQTGNPAYYFVGNIYRQTAYQNGVVVGDFIPAIRNSDNVVGMYDTVSGTFYTNAGTGVFVAGTPLGDGEVLKLTPSNDTAGVANLFKIGNYVDTQEILTGLITHKLGIYVFDGTEDWTFATGGNAPARLSLNNLIKGFPNTDVAPFVCSHFIPAAWNDISIASRTTPYIIISSTQTPFVAFTVGWDNTITDLDSWKAFLATQYAAGTPVIVVYPLATPYEEVAPIAQTMQTVAGDNTLDIVQAGMSGLEVSATYMKGVSVTITEIENANVGNDVEVIIA